MARAVHSVAVTPDELVMTGLGIQAWVLTLLGIRSAFAHQEIAMALEIIHALGNSYRLASSGVISSVAYGRLAMIFCRTAVAGLLADLLSRQNLLRIGIAMSRHGGRSPIDLMSDGTREIANHPNAAAGAGW